MSAHDIDPAPTPEAERDLTPAEHVHRLFGDLDDQLVAEFLLHFPSIELLDELYLWLEREGHIMAWQGRTSADGIAGILEHVMHGDLPAQKLSRPHRFSAGAAIHVPIR